MEAEVQRLCSVLQAQADALSLQGNFSDAGLMLTARQIIRVLWTQLHPPEQPQTNGQAPQPVPPEVSSEHATTG